ncbi:MAG: lytic transglycosylase domain-containing protein, partial [Mesorhizobium sp.]
NLSGASQSSDSKDEDKKPRETTDLCDPRQGLEWSPTEKACVQKRERAANVNLMLKPQ